MERGFLGAGCGLAASKERKFGHRAELIEGQKSMFRVKLSGPDVRDNQSKYIHITTEVEILSTIREYANPSR